MKGLAGLVAAAAVLFGGSAAAAEAAYGEVFDAAWRAIDENFYDPDFHGVDWAAVGARYRAQLPAVHDDAGLRRLLAAMLAELKTSHTYVSPPGGSPAIRWDVAAAFAEMEGRWTAIEVAPLGDARRQGLRPGDRLAGDPAALRGAPGTTASLAVEGCDGRRRTLSVRRERWSWPPEHPGWRWSRLSPAAGRSVGYLRVDRFDDGAAALADAAMAELADTEGLIIDLRGNSGGNISALRLASYFAPPGERPAVALLARPYLTALGRRPMAQDVAAGPKVVGAYTDEAVFRAVSDHGGAAVFYTEALDGRRYAKPVVVLIGPDTGSAAEGFAWTLRLNGGARFVGRPTAGALLSGETLDLPGGWRLTLPVHGLWGPDGRDFGDQAIAPDVSVAPTRADLCAGRDPELATALDLLRPPRTSPASP
jgi:carboxyl-terminal processing protease